MRPANPQFHCGEFVSPRRLVSKKPEGAKLAEVYLIVRPVVSRELRDSRCDRDELGFWLERGKHGEREGRGSQRTIEDLIAMKLGTD